MKKISRKCYVGKLPNACSITLLDSLEGRKEGQVRFDNNNRGGAEAAEDGRGRTDVALKSSDCLGTRRKRWVWARTDAISLLESEGGWDWD